MFGAFYLAATTIGAIVSGTKAAHENSIHIKEAEEKQRQGKNRAGIYTDRLGATRSLSTGKRVSIDNLYCAEAKGKDAYMYNEKGVPIRNMSEEVREERYAQTKKEADPRITVSLWKEGCTANLCGINGRPYYAGHTYKDLNNGKIYVCRMLEIPKEITGSTMKKVGFYMDINNGLLVRESDSSKEMARRSGKGPSEEIISKFIQEFNDKQRGEGYYCKSNIPNPKNFDMNGNESDMSKRIRLGDFYMNHKISYDII